MGRRKKDVSADNNDRRLVEAVYPKSSEEGKLSNEEQKRVKGMALASYCGVSGGSLKQMCWW